MLHRQSHGIFAFNDGIVVCMRKFYFRERIMMKELYYLMLHV